MRIGEVAALSGCHIETIRYYERMGLLPRPKRAASGYRQYTPQDVERLTFVTRGRALGFSLQEIEELIALAEDAQLNCADVDRLARKHLADIEDKRRALARMSRELKGVIGRCVGGTRAACRILETLRKPGKRHD